RPFGLRRTAARTCGTGSVSGRLKGGQSRQRSPVVGGVPPLPEPAKAVVGVGADEVRQPADVLGRDASLDGARERLDQLRLGNGGVPANRRGAVSRTRVATAVPGPMAVAR